MSHKGYPVSFKQRIPFGSLQEPSGDLLASDLISIFLLMLGTSRSY